MDLSIFQGRPFILEDLRQYDNDALAANGDATWTAFQPTDVEGKARFLPLAQ